MWIPGPRRIAGGWRLDNRRRCWRTPGHRIDREVPPLEVRLDRVPELDVMRPPVVRVLVVGPERRHLIPIRAGRDEDRSEAVFIDRPVELRLDLRWPGVGGHVPVERLPPEHDVAQRPADDVGRVARGPQPSEELEDGVGRADLHGRPDGGQFRPRNRYVRQVSLRSSARYGVKSE